MIETSGVGEKEGGVGFAEVEIDSPVVGDLASRYIVRFDPSVHSLMVFFCGAYAVC